MFGGSAIVQTVGRWLLAAETRVRCQSNTCEICGGHSGTGTGFFTRVSRFFPPVIIIPIMPHTHPHLEVVPTRGQTHEAWELPTAEDVSKCLYYASVSDTSVQPQ